MINLYEKVTNIIIAQLKAGTVPWVKPWAATAGRNTPCNAITNRPYSGINTLLLWQTVNHGFTVPRFLTFRQANACGGRVLKGQNGFKVYFVKSVEKKNEDDSIDDTDKRYTILKEYTVFNVDQCDGLPESVINPQVKVINKDQRLDLADDFVGATGADIRDGGEAYYNSAIDYISLPLWETFKTGDTYYATLFHELTHWTGHKLRLDRDLKNRFGSRAYAAEELVAELGSAYLCAEFGIDNYVRSASYIDNWITLLSHDNRALFTAASKASKAADYMRQLALRDPKWHSKHPGPLGTSPSIQPDGMKSEWDMSTRSTAPTVDHLARPLPTG